MGRNVDTVRKEEDYIEVPYSRAAEPVTVEASKTLQACVSR